MQITLHQVKNYVRNIKKKYNMKFLESSNMSKFKFDCSFIHFIFEFSLITYGHQKFPSPVTDNMTY